MAILGCRWEKARVSPFLDKEDGAAYDQFASRCFRID